MGDRTGLKKLDRTNGYDDGKNYMEVKKVKLAQQNDEIREALRHRNSIFRTDIFKGISINVNGRTQPTADELKRLILLNGGDYHPYYRYQTTKFMIATNLSLARIKNLRPNDRVIRPEWITDSISVKCLLPYQDYQLFMEEPRDQLTSTSSMRMLTSSHSDSALLTRPITDTQRSNSSNSSSSSSSRSNRRTSQKASQKKSVNTTKYKDIREMILKMSQPNKK